jgi:hypothetical protein
MPGRVQTLDRRMLTRRCVACGYDGALLRGGHASRCARCGCDLRQRPARSYAEMEGLLGLRIEAPEDPGLERGQERLLHRWLAFLFFTLLLIVAMMSLASATFNV